VYLIELEEAIIHSIGIALQMEQENSYRAHEQQGK
jgi:hypothetical protein